MPFDSTSFPAPVVTETDEVLRSLLETRERLALPHLWCKRTLRNDEGARCIVGAIHDYDENYRRRDDSPASLEAFIILERLSPSPHRGIVEFNNHSTTTHADVLALFDKAIAARRAELESA